MIAHPSVEKLLAEHGHTAAGRRKARAAVLEAILAAARHEAMFAGLSINCATRLRLYGPEHDPCGGGRSCLCTCHDPKEVDGGR